MISSKQLKRDFGGSLSYFTKERRKTKKSGKGYIKVKEVKESSRMSVLEKDRSKKEIIRKMILSKA